MHFHWKTFFSHSFTINGQVTDPSAQVPHFFLLVWQIDDFWMDAVRLFCECSEETVPSTKLNSEKGIFKVIRYFQQPPVCTEEWHLTGATPRIRLDSSLYLTSCWHMCHRGLALFWPSPWSYVWKHKRQGIFLSYLDEKTHFEGHVLTCSMAMSVAVLGSTIRPWLSTSGGLWRECITTLIFFKYFNWFQNNLAPAASVMLP